MAEKENKRKFGWNNIFPKSSREDNPVEQAKKELAERKPSSVAAYQKAGVKIGGAILGKAVLPLGALFIGITFLAPYLLPVAGMMGFVQLGAVAAFGAYSIIRQGPFSLLKGLGSDFLKCGNRLLQGKPLSAVGALFRTPLNILTLGAAQDGYDVAKAHHLRKAQYDKSVKARAKQIKQERLKKVGLSPKQEKRLKEELSVKKKAQKNFKHYRERLGAVQQKAAWAKMAKTIAKRDDAAAKERAAIDKKANGVEDKKKDLMAKAKYQHSFPAAFVDAAKKEVKRQKSLAYAQKQLKQLNGGEAEARQRQKIKELTEKDTRPSDTVMDEFEAVRSKRIAKLEAALEGKAIAEQAGDEQPVVDKTQPQGEPATPDDFSQNEGPGAPSQDPEEVVVGAPDPGAEKPLNKPGAKPHTSILGPGPADFVRDPSGNLALDGDFSGTIDNEGARGIVTPSKEAKKPEDVVLGLTSTDKLPEGGIKDGVSVGGEIRKSVVNGQLIDKNTGPVVFDREPDGPASPQANSFDGVADRLKTTGNVKRADASKPTYRMSATGKLDNKGRFTF